MLMRIPRAHVLQLDLLLLICRVSFEFCDQPEELRAEVGSFLIPGIRLYSVVTGLNKTIFILFCI